MDRTLVPFDEFFKSIDRHTSRLYSSTNSLLSQEVRYQIKDGFQTLPAFVQSCQRIGNPWAKQWLDYCAPPILDRDQ